MANYELVMPKMGESIFEATILNWLVEEGQTIDHDEIILEVATDKVDSEIPSPVAGKVIELKATVDQVVNVGDVIAVIETEGDDGKHSKLIADTDTNGANNGNEHTTPEVPTSVVVNETVRKLKDKKDRFYSPLVRTIARKENISKEELESIQGTGMGGRVTKQDVMEFLILKSDDGSKEQHKASKEEDIVEAFEENVTKSSHDSDLEEVVNMTRVRSTISKHMIRSKETAAHVTSVIEADMTKMVEWRNRNKVKFQEKYGVKLTYTPIFLKILSELLREFPYLNSSVEGDKVILKKYINIGIATALPDHTLIVPVVKNADQYSLAGLAKQSNDLISRARKNALKADEIRQGTFTISNIGTFDNLIGTPIINQPEVAILAAGAIKKKPAVIETAEGDFIGIRQKMYLSLSFDHRIIDGYLGGSFLKEIATKFESFDEDDF